MQVARLHPSMLSRWTLQVPLSERRSSSSGSSETTFITLAGFSGAAGNNLGEPGAALDVGLDGDAPMRVYFLQNLQLEGALRVVGGEGLE